ncbi:hypothetical protein [Methylococcus mesophilus]|uniref:hypothetical protein n=1 Tax=Methylococcus mesophilus TaxID=2993564 RepID=UPI00224B2CE3|nr:hypothetical protein [Methylococcus mesophilus]UZR29049.1 hypothetical protein OOT43_00045 [Methylococcus mesophilus]
MKRLTILVVIPTSLLAGCAGLDFGDDKGLVYYDPRPYLFVATTKECVSTAIPVMLPGEQKSVRFKSGYGTADLSVTLSNGMITNVGQKTDTKIPETIQAVANLGAAAAGMKMVPEEAKPACEPSAVLYPVVNGVPDNSKPIRFPVRLAD